MPLYLVVSMFKFFIVLFSTEQILQLYKAQLDLFIEAFPLVYYARTAMDAEANKQFELGRSLITKRYSDLLTREASLNTTLRRSFNDSGT